ncbi:unnamed protein product [Ambrosiozyma monospora]|uniref:Unnamed protein product n=1 Tax=Ambrosiozyma monospora TaxID=43982 RepID=A0A9W6Z2B3_AMBMO|nr:unnamed protein product [Ambrosiozyma monospora]
MAIATLKPQFEKERIVRKMPATQTLVLPGDEIQITSDPTQEITLGPNVKLAPSTSANGNQCNEEEDDDDKLIPTTAGLLNIQQKKATDIYFIESNTKRYTPQVNDLVIGTILGGFDVYYRVSLNNFSPPVLLNQFAFPNATKKNRPHLKNGDVVFARVSNCERNVDAELSCVDPITGKDGGFGLLDGGILVDVKLAYARYLLFEPEAPVLQALVKKCKFETAIGVNGKIWIKTDDLKTTIACVQVIQSSQNWESKDIKKNVAQIFKKLGL